LRQVNRKGRTPTGLARDLDVAALDRRQAAVVSQHLPALHLLGRIVDGQVRGWLEEPNAPHTVPADAAGREVGDAAIHESYPHVRDIHASGQDRHPDRLDGLDLRFNE